MTKTVLETPFCAPFTLIRYPARKNEVLQAWDSADELLLNHLNQHYKKEGLSSKNILIVNDSFGALSIPLSEFSPTSYSDSFVSTRGTELNFNLARNGALQSPHPHSSINQIHSFEKLSGTYDLVLIKLPNHLSFFEDTLARLSSHLHTHSLIIFAGMVKYITATYFDLIQKYIGPTTTSLAEKKARLIFAPFERTASVSPFPIKVSMEKFEKKFIHYSHLFSREKLDIGTRFFLEHLPEFGNFNQILDLGCANGIVGIRAKQMHPHSTVFFSDDSAMAIQSARANYSQFFQDQGSTDSNPAQFSWTNCFENQKSDFLDLVLCNPPFHQKATVGDFIALQMFADAHHSLKPRASLRIIGNSHLGYEAKLKRTFSSVEVIARNAKFTVLDAKK